MRYHWRFILSLITAAHFANLAAPLQPPWDDIRVKHMWKAVPANWESLGHPPAGTAIDLYIALRPQHEGALIDALYEVSDPDHPKYGAHLSKEQVAALVAPHPDSLKLVNLWLEHKGVPPSSISITHGGKWLTVTGVPVSQANELLSASYEIHRHAKTNETIIRTVSYALPAVLHPHVRTVVPTTFFASTHTLQQTPSRRFDGAAAKKAEAARGKLAKARANREIDSFPSYLRWLYKTFAYKPSKMDQNSLAIAGYSNQYPNPRDLTLFMTEFRIDAKPASFTVKQINGGGYDANLPGDAPSVNIQYGSAMAYPIPLIYYSLGGEVKMLPTGEPALGDVFLEWFNIMLDKENVDIPRTIIISFSVDEQDCPEEYAKTVCDMFAELGTRGVSIVVGSGDNGVGKGACRGEDGTLEVQFIPLFPASCPWVTSVGGLMDYPEVAAGLSGGGFSDIFPRPKYQKDEVPPFVKKLDRQYAGFYNPDGRGIPDISAQALNYVIVVKTILRVVNGTTCAATTMGGLFSLLNDYRLSRGEAALGFLNPFLYGRGLSGMEDITSGSNPGCETPGFSATAGWDPVTGLGAPDFFELQHVIEYRMGGT